MAQSTLFVPLVGQFDNIGDVFLRRQLAGWIGDCGPSSVLVGDAPEEFVEALGLPASSTVFRSLPNWLSKIAGAPRGSSYVYKPGEIQLSAPGMKEHVGLLPVVGLLKARGGRVARVGVGARAGSPIFSKFCAPSTALSDISWWRDDFTRQVMGSGTVIPDLAFAEGSPASEWAETGRRLLIVSLRGDRVPPRNAWCEGIRIFAEHAGLEMVVLSQVRRDDVMATEVAERLGARCELFASERSLAHEDKVRKLYRAATLVVSDRLHVLIGAVTEGATVKAAVDGGSQKIARHFAVLDSVDVSVDTSNFPSGVDIAEVLRNTAESAQCPVSMVNGARTRLERARQDFINTMAM